MINHDQSEFLEIFDLFLKLSYLIGIIPAKYFCEITFQTAVEKFQQKFLPNFQVRFIFLRNWRVEKFRYLENVVITMFD